MPTANTNRFVIPDTNEMNFFKSIFIRLKNNDIAGIDSEITKFNYIFAEFIDTTLNKKCYILMERTPIQFGWGTFILNNIFLNDITIEVPHPIWDTNSWYVGIKVFIKINAKWFIMAGTHRYANTDSSSDVAHNSKSIFNVAHQTIASPISIQIHGFNKSNNIYLGYPDIVISNGTLYPQDILYALSRNFEIFNFSTGVFSKLTYSQLSRLGATTNVQGKWSNNNNLIFIHIEFDYPLRTNEQNIHKITLAMYRTFLSPETTNNYSKIKLFQNYPNPCNTHTTIEFQIPLKTSVELNIYDILGKKIFYSTISTESAGKHFIKIPLENLASGTYYYELKTDSYRESKKMIILK